VNMKRRGLSSRKADITALASIGIRRIDDPSGQAMGEGRMQGLRMQARIRTAAAGGRHVTNGTL